MTEQFIRLGSVVLDRARNTPLRVVGRDHRDAVEHPEVDVDDAMAQQYGLTESDDVYKCVFLPTGEDKVSSPRKSYAYPASRLPRFPVEAALPDNARRIHTQIIEEVLADVLLAADVQGTSVRQNVETAISRSNIDAELPPEVLLEEAAEIADRGGVSRGVLLAQIAARYVGVNGPLNRDYRRRVINADESPSTVGWEP